MKRSQANPVKIGAFVLVGIVILVAAVLLIGSGRFFRRTQSFVSYFDGSVNGLRAGAQVKFKGVEIGRVDRVRIPFGMARTDQPIAVFFSLDRDQIDDEGDRSGPRGDTLQAAIKNGLRAQLESDSLLTGVQHVSLAFAPDTEERLHVPIEGLVEMPTVPPPLQQIGDEIRTIVDRVGRYDFEALFDSLKKTLDATTDLARAPELKSAIGSLDSTLKSVQQAVAKLEQHIDPLAARLEALAQRADAVGTDVQQGIGTARATLESVRAMSDNVTASVRPLAVSLKAASDQLQAMAEEMQSTLARTRVLLDPDAPIAVELRAGLREMVETARATRALFELLERNPAALLRGRGEKENPPR